MKYLEIMRPADWTKNMFVFAAFIFGKKLAGTFNEVLVAFGSAVGACVCFCLASSAIYIFNDIIDRDADRLHPEKSMRPIATGTVSVGSAAVMSIICVVVSLMGSYVLVPGLAVIIAAYIVLMVLYSLILKRVMILDCVVISVGFCLRAVAGAVVVGVFISPWLVICTFALCLFLGFGKRRSEIAQLQEDSESFRETLAGYTPELLAHMLDVTSGLAIACFVLYAMDDQTLRFRFSALIQKGRYSGPVQFILNDLPFQIGFIVWVVLCIGIIYVA
jgi:4-hydroxybenzoate polyprenyltransferase